MEIFFKIMRCLMMRDQPPLHYVMFWVWLLGTLMWLYISPIYPLEFLFLFAYLCTPVSETCNKEIMGGQIFVKPVLHLFILFINSGDLLQNTRLVKLGLAARLHPTTSHA